MPRAWACGRSHCGHRRARGLQMKILPPVSISARGLLAGRWDLLAAILVFGAIAMNTRPAVSTTARGLLAGRWTLLATILVSAAIAMTADERPSLAAPPATLKSNGLSLSPWA